MDYRALSPELEAIARRDLNEVPERRDQDLKHLRDWLSKQPHLHARTDSQWLLTFLRGCKFSLERTKEKLDMYYTLRSAVPEYFKNRDPMLPEMQYLLNLGMMVPLPDLDDEGRRVVLVRQGLHDPSKVKVSDLLKFNMMFSDYVLLNEDTAVVCGTVSVMDNSKNTLAHMTSFTPLIMKRAMTIFQDGYPQRPKGMHMVNINPAFVTFFNLMKTFMKEKMKKRLFMHENMESVYQYVPKRILPLEYGGEAGPIDNIVAEWKKKLEAHRSWFLEDDKFYCDEKKRPGKPKTHEDLFGLEGSFRQLNVD